MCPVLIDAGNCFDARTKAVRDGLRPATLVAANGGLPGGGTNKNGKYVESGNPQQEEASMKKLIEELNANTDGKTYVEQYLMPRWGLYETGTDTIQGINYTTCDPKAHSRVLADVETHVGFWTFVAAPNASGAGKPGNSMRRTRSDKAARNFSFHREGVKQSVIGFLAACADKKNRRVLPIICLIGCGVYAGVHKKRITECFPFIVNEALHTIHNGALLGTYFVKVVIATNEDAKSGSTTATPAASEGQCQYGAKCTRQNPDHIARFHSEKKGGGIVSLPQSARGGSSCTYGDSCYRTNPDHIAQCHHGLSLHQRQQHQPHQPHQPHRMEANTTPCQVSFATTAREYGGRCYRTDPEHVRDCHGGVQPDMRGVSKPPAQAGNVRDFHRDVLQSAERSVHVSRPPPSCSYRYAVCDYRADECKRARDGDLAHIEACHRQQWGIIQQRHYCLGP